MPTPMDHLAFALGLLLGATSGVLAQPDWVTIDVFDGPRMPFDAGATPYDIAADMAGGVLVIVGTSYDLDNRPNPTWIRQNNTWIQSEATLPYGNGNYALAHDQARGETLIIGGWELLPAGFDVIEGFPRRDVYALHGGADVASWQPRASLPRPLLAHRAAYDSANAETVVYGGTDSETYFFFNYRAGFEDTLTFDGTAWTQHSVPGPGQRFNHDMAYDPVREQTILFGGQGPLSDRDFAEPHTWAWDGASWSVVAIEGPPALVNHQMIWDPTRAQILLVGGKRTGCGQLFNCQNTETWAWDGVSWSTLDVGVPMQPRFSFAAAMDPVRGAPLVVGGASGVLGGNSVRVLTTQILTTLCSPADRTADGIIDNNDIFLFVRLFLDAAPEVDLNGDGVHDLGDISTYVSAFLTGC